MLVSLTRIDIVKDGGVVVQTNTPTPTTSVRWTQEIHDFTAR
jgi:hypothetical protein